MPGETATHKLPYALGADKPPSVPTITKAMSEKIEALLSKGGDVTIAADGTVTIGGEKVTAGMLKALAVEEGKIKDGAVTRAKLAASAKASIIATEESRTNAAYGKLTTPDEVTGIVVPANALVAIEFDALWKESVSDTARAAIFIGANQLKVDNGEALPRVQAARTGGSAGAFFTPLLSDPIGLISTQATGENAVKVTTGLATATTSITTFYDINNGGKKERTLGGGGLLVVCDLPAATYAVSVQYKSASGTVTVKERRLRVWTQEFA